MKKLIVGLLSTCVFIGNSGAAVPAGRQAQRTQNATTQSATMSGGRTTTSARSATAVRGASNAAATTAARAATSNRTTVSRSAATPTTAKPGVAARAASTQKVINNSTKITTATKNVVVNEACQQKYEGCMDTFCMLDNTSGGRCICSDRNAELNTVLTEIEKLDQQSYQMATFGVEKIEMGADADTVIANAMSVAQSFSKDNSGTRRKLDIISMTGLNTDDEEDEDDLWFEDTPSLTSVIDGKTGDRLYNAANELCIAQVPECASELQMLQLIYSQRVKSDCAAYENSLKQQKTASAQKLATAEQALRDAALEQFRNANKYDLGQCTTAFKQCMQTTAGCGDDFSGCASVAANDQTNTRKSTKKDSNKTVPIQGTHTTIEIAASTYDTLIAKRPLCESVTKSCVSVGSSVWDTFLREVAPQLKSAELIAEDNIRQNCISSISDCFQKACKDTIDPNDPDGSYDMCLTRPETMLNLCKVPLNACGINADSKKEAEQSQIWQYVVARLASIRVDSCTTEVKECLQSSDRCGKDYTQCVGLDTDTIIRMCPYEKLVGCQKQYGSDKIQGDDVYDVLSSMVQGIMLNIDNNMLQYCQNALDQAMINVCGDTENCNSMATDDGIGARTLEYKICEYKDGDYTTDCRNSIDLITTNDLKLDGNGKRKSFAGQITGQIPWQNLEFTNVDEKTGLITIKDDFMAGVTLPKSDDKNAVESELLTLQRNITSAIAAIESDQIVDYCVTGRNVQGMRKNGSDEINFLRGGQARFPYLTNQVRSTIVASALKKAKDNYYNKYDELNTKMSQDYVSISEKIARADNEDALEYRRDRARESCNNLAKGTALATSAGKNNTASEAVEINYVGSQSRNDWNYKETITTTFSDPTLICHRCKRTQNCKTPKNKWCKEWDEEVETCDDIQF